MTLPHDVVEVLRKAASHPEGAATLFEGNLESAAALYQVHPTQVESVRGWLRDPQRRLESRAVLNQTPPAGPATVEREVRRGPEAVIAEATARPGGLELLTLAPVEAAAVLLGVHPFTIDEARARLEARRQVALVTPEVLVATTPVRPSSPGPAGRFVGRPS